MKLRDLAPGFIEFRVCKQPLNDNVMNQMVVMIPNRLIYIPRWGSHALNLNFKKLVCSQTSPKRQEVRSFHDGH